MFNGQRTIEHEENVVRIVNLFRWKRIEKWFKFCYWKITCFFLKSYCLLTFSKDCILRSLCSKYMPPAKSITLHLDFHTFTVKHLSWYGWMNFGSGKVLWCRQYYQLTDYHWVPACNNGYPLTKKKNPTSGVRLAYSGFRLLSTLFLIRMCWFPEPCISV